MTAVSTRPKKRASTRARAAKRGTSVSGLVAAELDRLVAEDERYEEAWRQARKAMGDATGRGGRRWERDELHDR